VDSEADFDGGTFTLSYGGTIFKGNIDPNETYDLVAFIRDGVDFDLDKIVNGKIISAIFLAREKVINVVGPVTPTFPPKKDDVTNKTDLDPNDLEERDGKVYLSKSLAEKVAKELLKVKAVDTHILPIFEATFTPNGSVAEIRFEVKGKDLLALHPDDINLIGMISKSTGKLFDYVNKATDFDDGTFTLLLDGKIFNGVIDPNKTYELVAFIKDGGIFDLDKIVNGKIISAIFLACEKGGKRGGGGCDAGYGYLAFALLGVIPLVFRKVK
jgi:hypothetical protein